ncbi:MAG: FAD-dependent oxidoreductase [Acidobacteria bacterium]|nr:FAD-dependent oxidoreductase [Acidobacteriota bacterium]
MAEPGDRAPQGDPDVIIIGAGAAGLRAACLLSRHDLNVQVIEARSRLGGRILTRRTDRWPLPIELGAELIHGPADETKRLLDTEDIEQLPDDHFLRERGFLTHLDKFYKTLSDASKKVPHQVSTAEEALAVISKRDERSASLVRMFVEGFHAADPATLSWKAMIGEDGDLAQTLQFRPRGGYDQVINRMESELGSNVRIRLSTEVRRIEWKRDHAKLTLLHDGETSTQNASRVIVTVPLSILQDEAIVFDPIIPAVTEACRNLQVGHVVKLWLVFTNPFWRNPGLAAMRTTGKSSPPLNFIHDPEESFSTWWTMAPSSAPILVAWAGGPKAAALSGRSLDSLVDIALENLASLLEIDQRMIRAKFIAAHHHDWSSDPWSRGAYSFPGVNGEKAREHLNRPVEETIFFAGEALAEQAGTVEGALQSGRRAAERVLLGLSVIHGR